MKLDPIFELGHVFRHRRFAVLIDDDLIQTDIAAQVVLNLQGRKPLIPGDLPDSCYRISVLGKDDIFQLSIHQHRMIVR